jgi:galacturonosyltransferase
MKKKNIAMKMLMLGNHGGAFYSFRREIIEQMIKLGHEVVIASPYNPRIETLKDGGAKYVKFDLERKSVNPIKELGLILRYRKLFKTVEPDAVLSFTIKPTLYGGIVCRQLKIPHIANITGLHSLVVTGALPFRKFLLFLYRYSLSHATRVFFQNRLNMDLFHKYSIATDNGMLIPGSGVNLDRFPFAEYPESGEVAFAMVGRVIKIKGVEQYFDAAEIVAREHPNAVFHYYGDIEEEDLRDKIMELNSKGTISFHGESDDMQSVYGGIHCLIHPSFAEGMSNVILEAFATGRPAIGSDINGVKEIIDDGENGYLFPAGDSGALVTRIEQFLALGESERTEMGRSARAKVERTFDRNIVVGAYMSELEAL